MQVYHASANYQNLFVFLRLTSNSIIFMFTLHFQYCVACYFQYCDVYGPLPLTAWTRELYSSSLLGTIYILLLNSVSILDIYASLIIVLVGCKLKQILSRWWKKVVGREKKKSLIPSERLHMLLMISTTL